MIVGKRHKEHGDRDLKSEIRNALHLEIWGGDEDHDGFDENGFIRISTLG